MTRGTQLASPGWALPLSSPIAVRSTREGCASVDVVLSSGASYSRGPDAARVNMSIASGRSVVLRSSGGSRGARAILLGVSLSVRSGSLYTEDVEFVGGKGGVAVDGSDMMSVTSYEAHRCTFRDVHGASVISVTGQNTNTTLVGCELRNNSFAFYGVLMIKPSRGPCGVQIDACVLTGNSADFGAVVGFEGGAGLDVRIYDSRVFQNIASFGGAAVVYRGSAAGARLSMARVVVEDTMGTAISITGKGHVAIDASVFRNNTVDHILDNYGAGVTVSPGDEELDLVIANSIVDSNLVLAPQGYAQGAGISITSRGRTSLSNCTVKNNTLLGSGRGGGFFFSTLQDGGNGGELNLTDCIFESNTALTAGNVSEGGGVYLGVSGGSVRIDGCTFRGQRVGGSGAGVFIASDSSASIAIVHNCTFEDNIASTIGSTGAVGGGVAMTGQLQVQMRRCRFSGQIADDAGAAIRIMSCLPGSNIEVSGCVLENRWYNGLTRVTGATLFDAKDCSYSSIQLTDCIVNGTAAAGETEATGVYVVGSPGLLFHLQNCTIIAGATDLENAALHYIGLGDLRCTWCSIHMPPGMPGQFALGFFGQGLILDETFITGNAHFATGSVSAYGGSISGEMKCGAGVALRLFGATLSSVTMRLSTPLELSGVKLLGNSFLSIQAGGQLICSGCVFEGSWYVVTNLCNGFVFNNGSVLSGGWIVSNGALAPLVFSDTRVDSTSIINNRIEYGPGAGVVVNNSVLRGTSLQMWSAVNVLRASILESGTVISLAATANLSSVEGVVVGTGARLVVGGAGIRFIRTAFCGTGSLHLSDDVVQCDAATRIKKPPIVQADANTNLPPAFMTELARRCKVNIDRIPIEELRQNSTFSVAMCGGGQSPAIDMTGMLYTSFQSLGLRVYWPGGQSTPLRSVEGLRFTVNGTSHMYRDSSFYTFVPHPVPVSGSGIPVHVSVQNVASYPAAVSACLEGSTPGLSSSNTKASLDGGGIILGGKHSTYGVTISVRDVFKEPLSVRALLYDVNASYGHVNCRNNTFAPVILCTLTLPDDVYFGLVTFTMQRSGDPVKHISGGVRVVWMGLIIICACVGAVLVGAVLLWQVRRWRRQRVEQRTDNILKDHGRFVHATRLVASGSVDSEGPHFEHGLVLEPGSVKVLRVIAAGASGNVGLGRWNGVDVAVKVYHMPLESVMAEWVNEVRTLRDMRHPNVVQLYGVQHSPPSIVTEFLHRGSLDALLEGGAGCLSWERRLQFALDIARGMAYLHSHDMAHRDLKSANVFIGRDWTAKVGDLGAASRGGSMMHSTVGTLMWMAPEVFDISGTASYDKRADVYSFGIILWELWTQQLPYEDDCEDVPQGLGAFMRYVACDGRPKVPDSMPAEYADLMVRCWKGNADERPVFDDAVCELQQQVDHMAGEDGGRGVSVRRSDGDELAEVGGRGSLGSSSLTTALLSRHESVIGRVI